MPCSLSYRSARTTAEITYLQVLPRASALTPADKEGVGQLNRTNGPVLRSSILENSLKTFYCPRANSCVEYQCTQ